MKNLYEVKYLDNKDSMSVMTQEVEADDEAEALEIAMEDDYYFGKFIETSLVREGDE